ncbi:3-hydroxyacyl-CoA dehydrogenase NAD-binding domain-containing protein [Xenophilus azovorans]|uniref:3-hydroxyacyl-CoA dehydrogenase NAD-binding domain-containing protein n=1 Tax=Xenophilus azovorans TaxID=151755 RepID=UPI00068E1A47|nr:3-hydroxyacyl-CoA dehydrogenase NAD-binding domain-containing protein [Xenophilus azovorans]
MSQSPVVRCEREGEVLLILIDNPPINAGSAPVRAGLVDAVAQAEADSEIRAAVIMGAGNTFVAGSDLREFGQPLQDPQLPAVIEAIERCGKPIVAALHGAALGGGFELALGCDARVALRGTVVGLPEVTLGIIPGAGGTQRLPRLVGRPRALKMICSGERVGAAEALVSGIIDAVVDADLRTAALRYASEMGAKRRVRDLPVPADDAAAFEEAATRALKAGRNRPNVAAAIVAVRSTGARDFDEGLYQEREAFQALRVAPDAFALRHLFFAERQSARPAPLEGTDPKAVHSVAVIGAGTMGSGIAIAALDAGCQVLLVEQDADALQRGTDRVNKHYASRVAAGKLAKERAADCEQRMAPTLDWARIREADLIIEAVFEDLAIKRTVFERLDGVARPGAVLASNTSYLDLDAIAAATGRPQDVIGLHFFSPAQVMRLVEVVGGAKSSAQALATGVQLTKRMGKLPVLTRNAFGFIGNRIYAAYRRQCEFMLEEGAYPRDVDAALEAWGFAMGPFAVADMSGLDIAWRMRQAQAARRDPAARYVEIPDRLCERGRLGRKTGLGYYAYPEGGARPQVDAAVHALIDEASRAKGLVRRSLAAEEVQRRALLSMVNEAALLVAEGVAFQTADVDLVLVNGYGFPRWQGGPVWWARQRGREALRQELVWLAGLSGSGFKAGDPDVLLDPKQG